MRFPQGFKKSAIGLSTAITAMAIAAPAMAGLGQPTNGKIGFQEAATDVQRDIEWLHNVILMPIITAITVIVMILMLIIMVKFREKANPEPSKTSHNTILEIVWTIIPVLILLFIAPFSMKLLYKQDVLPETTMQITATANTWYWDYSYSEYEDISMTSNIIDVSEEAKMGEVRLSHADITRQLADQLKGRPYLLATDNPLVVPINTNIEVLVTSEGNYHAFTVPSFGIKVDAMPGRFNSTWFNSDIAGRFYGQCAEICGIKHAFMPIEVVVLEQSEFQQWVANGGEFSEGMNQYLPSGNAKRAALDLKE